LEVLRLEREKRGLLQFQVARALGISAATLCRYELGAQGVPLDVVAKATRYFQCPKIADAACRDCPVARARQDVTQKWSLGRGLRRAA